MSTFNPNPTDFAAPLTGARVLVTRPEHQADALCAAITQAGGTSLRLPLLEIEPAADDTTLARQLDAARTADWWLFTSRNAAAQACRLCPPPWTARVAAVGEGTAAELRANGVNEVLVPPGRYSLAALAALPPFQNLSGRRIVLITGADGNPEGPRLLTAAGAALVVLALYRRVPRGHPPAQVAALLNQADAAIITSGAGLEQLLALTPTDCLPRLLGLQLVVPAPRVVELARLKGFWVPPLLPEQMTDAALAEALGRWWRAIPDTSSGVISGDIPSAACPSTAPPDHD